MVRRFAHLTWTRVCGLKLSHTVCLSHAETMIKY